MPIGTNNLGYSKGTSYDYGRWNRRDIPAWVVVDDWNSAYYSGLDVSMYFGQVFMDEIIQLQYQEVERVKPLYGYADYVFRKVSRGSRIVQGTYTINFKEAGYIPKLLEVLKNKDALAADTLNLASAAGDAAAENAARLALENDFTLEDFLTMSTNGQYEKNSAATDSMFSSMMNALDKTYWGDNSTLVDGSEINAADMSRIRERARTRPRYGSSEEGFDIVIKYGQPEDAGAHKTGWGTIEKITNCHITGFSKTIDDSGRNILETYNFLAATLE